MKIVSSARTGERRVSERRCAARDGHRATSSPATGTALVAVGRRTSGEWSDGLHGGERPRAPFLAHLIATAQLLAQTRTKRRAAPEDAAGAYRPAVRSACGTRMSRSV